MRAAGSAHNAVERANWCATPEQKLLARGEATGEARGEARGKAADVLLVLDARGIAVPDDVRDRATACTDLDQLGIWLRRAATAESAHDLFA